MFHIINEFFSKLFGRRAETDTVKQAPYKIEAPATDWPFPKAHVDAKASTQVKCGCGRSQTGFCVGLHSLSPEEWATHADNPVKPKKTRTRKPAVEKPVVLKKPRARKTTKK